MLIHQTIENLHFDFFVINSKCHSNQLELIHMPKNSIFFLTQFLCQAICTQEPRRNPSNRRLNEHGIYIRHCQESNSQPVPSQAGADTTRPLTDNLYFTLFSRYSALKIQDLDLSALKHCIASQYILCFFSR